MLSVRFEYAADLTDAEVPVRVRETRGGITYELHSGGLFLPAGVAALNAVTQALLDGGTLLQMWRGEIIGGPASPVRGHDGAWLHRGPLADQEARPRNR